ncbi:NYN domain-containing protein [bacterium]|nr:NYN domain-containing protein [candidate division CSSED10-310 bacterium]
MSEARIVLLIDMDNIIYASENTGLGRFQVTPIIEILKEKGRLIIKRAYADWREHHDYRYEIQDHAIDLIELPQRGRTNKNSTDIKMVVDAMEIAMTLKHVDTFAIVTGDKDFFPLVSKLREYSFQIIGFGVFESTSDLLVQNCDEFIYYNNLVKSQRLTSDIDKENIFNLLISAVKALLKDGLEFVPAAQIRKTILRKNPAFHVGNFGFKSFSGFLRAGMKQGYIRLKNNPQTGFLEIGLPRPPALELEPESINAVNEDMETDDGEFDSYSSVLNSVGLRPWDPESRQKIIRDFKKLTLEPRDPGDMVLTALIDDLVEQYQKDNVKIHKSQIRDIIRMMMYVGSFKDSKGRLVTSYSAPIESFNLAKTLSWVNALCLVHVLKFDPTLSKPTEAAKLLFGTGNRVPELQKLISSMESLDLIKTSKTGSETEYKVTTDRYFAPWK